MRRPPAVRPPPSPETVTETAPETAVPCWPLFLFPFYICLSPAEPRMRRNHYGHGEKKMAPLPTLLPVRASTSTVSAPPSNGSVVVPFAPHGVLFFVSMPRLADAHRDREERRGRDGGALCRHARGQNPVSFFTLFKF